MNACEMVWAAAFCPILNHALRSARRRIRARIGEIIAAWQNVGMTENAVNTAVTSTSSPAIPAETSAVSPQLAQPTARWAHRWASTPPACCFLGAGELGGKWPSSSCDWARGVCAADSYAGAPAQQVAHEYRALDMANAAGIAALFDEIKPDIIVPEVEAIAHRFWPVLRPWGRPGGAERRNRTICMDREPCAYWPTKNWALPTTTARFAGSLEELRAGASEVGYPCVVKPGDDSSGTASRWCVPPTPSIPRGPGSAGRAAAAAADGCRRHR